MLRLRWLTHVSAIGSPRATRRRLRPFCPDLLRLEPRELLTVAVVAPAGALNFKEGAANIGVNLGQFFSLDVAKGISFQVAINWGDGTPIDNQVVAFPTPLFEVTGSHTYADETAPGKPFNVTVTVTDPSDGSPPASLIDTADVAEADVLSPVAFADFAAKEGQTATATATFNNANLTAPAGDFTATIDWGDGKTDPGLAVTGGNGVFTVNGTHVYADEGAFTSIVTISDDPPGTAIASATATATIADADQLSLASFADFASVEGQTATATATFNDAYPAAQSGDFTATINWGDGTIDSGQAVTGGAGVFTVSGQHVYADEGTFKPIVTISDDAPGTAIASATATATIADADQLSVASFANFAALEGKTATATATFNDAYLVAPAGDFTATINWADGKIDAGLAVTGGAGLFTVSGQHVYADEGTFTATVTISDDAPGTAAATATTLATINEGGVLTTTPKLVTGTENAPLSNVLVTSFTSDDSDATAGSYTASIDWGDAVTSAGTVTSGGPGLYLVSGSHLFQDEGPYPITVVVRDDDSTATTTIDTTATIAKGPTGGIQGTTAQDFVGHTYRDILLRPADQPSFTAMTQEILHGTPFSDVASLLDHSAEYYGQVVDRAYETYLGRGSDAGGRSYWIDALQHGLTDESLAAVLIASDEFFNQAGGTNPLWIDATYLKLFERPADSNGESFWLAALTRGESRSQVVLSIATSPEHEVFVVQADYSHFLGRTGGGTEIGYWVRQMNQGLSDEDLVTLFVTSDEYLQQISD